MQGDLAISTQGTAAVMPHTPLFGRRGAAAPGVPTQELWLRADPAELRTARRFAESASDHFGLSEDARFRFTLAVNEAVANAIEHGEPSADGRVQLKIYTQGESLAFEVRDWGRFGVSFPQQDSMQERGRGLAMMASLVDEVDLKPSDGSTVVRLLVRAA